MHVTTASCGAFVRTLSQANSQRGNGTGTIVEEPSLASHVTFLKTILTPATAPSTKASIVALCLSWLLCEELTRTLRQLVQLLKTPLTSSSNSLLTSTAPNSTQVQNTSTSISIATTAHELCGPIMDALSQASSSETGAANADAAVATLSRKLLTAIAFQILTIPAIETNALVLQVLPMPHVSCPIFPRFSAEPLRTLFSIPCCFSQY